MNAFYSTIIEQQITLYPHRDTNNLWRILNATADGGHESDWQSQPLELLKPHVRIKLRHIETDKALHSHDVRPPVSDVDFQNEVSAYGMAGFVGDANDDWYLEIAKGDKRDKESGKRLRTLRTHFRLRHALTGCYLFSHKIKLPEWGWEQQEVTCNKNAVMANSLWFVETSTHPLCTYYSSWSSDNCGNNGILQSLRMARKSTTDCLGSLPNLPSCSK
jgi:dolichyl-phosphate-mannose-protein mannosyltransferase